MKCHYCETQAKRIRKDRNAKSWPISKYAYVLTYHKIQQERLDTRRLSYKDSINAAKN
jgi:hypothetical protein